MRWLGWVQGREPDIQVRRDTLEGEHIPIRCPVTIPVHWGMTDSQDSKVQRSSEPDCSRPSPSNPDPGPENPTWSPTLSPTLEGFVGLDEDESSAAEIHEAAEELADAFFAATEPPDPTRRVRPYRRIRTRTRVQRTRP